MFLTYLPVWLAGMLLVGLPTLLAVVCQVLLRRRVGLEILSSNNEVAGFKFAAVGVLYAVLLAFAVLVVWEKFADAENTVASESSAAAAIFRLSEGLPGDTGLHLRHSLSSYLHSAIVDEWVSMERGRGSTQTTQALQVIYTDILAIAPTDERGAVLMAEVIRQLDQVTQARRARLVVAAGIVPGVVWFVLWAGAIITVGFTFFFATENLKAQTMMTGGLSVLVFSGLMVIVAIDRPFAGSVKVTPEALEVVLKDLGEK